MTLSPYAPDDDDYNDMDIASLSHKYNPYSTMNKGAMIPFTVSTSTFLLPSPSLGVSFITEDATETHRLLSTIGYVPETDSLALGVYYSASIFSFSYTGEINPDYYNWEIDA